MFSEFIFSSENPWRFLQILFFLTMMALFVLVYVKFRRSQPHIYLRNLPNPVPLRDYSVLAEEDRAEAKYFWEFLALFLADFEKRGHPLQYRQLIDMLKFGPIQDMKDFGAVTLTESKHLKKYASDDELRVEIYEILIENLNTADLPEESATKHANLLLALPLTSDEMRKIISIFEQDSMKLSYTIDEVVVKLKKSLSNVDA